MGTNQRAKIALIRSFSHRWGVDASFLDVLDDPNVTRKRGSNPPRYRPVTEIPETPFTHVAIPDGLIEFLHDKDRVCAIQVWREFYREEGEMMLLKSREINNILRSVPDWEQYTGGGGKLRIPGYGIQRCYVRINYLE